MSNYILTIGTAIWNVTSGSIPDPNKVYIQGTGPDGINLPSTKASVSGSQITLSNVAATQGFVPHQTKYYSSFSIQWQISFDGGSSWQDAGTSQNPIYVCISQNPDAVTLFRTVVHLACSNAGATTPDEALSKTWSLFSGRSVCKWSESAQSFNVPLYYYRADTNFNDNGDGTTAFLLNNSKQTGQCRCWASIMSDALTVNGASSIKIEATAKNATLTPPSGPPITVSQSFWVNDWTFGTASNPLPWTGYPYLFDIASSDDMVPPPTGQVYGDLTNNKNTLPGQHTSPPSEKFFGNHVFLKYTNHASPPVVTYYDPSYGGKYNDEGDFQSQAIAAYGFFYQTAPDGTHQYLLQKPAATNVQIQFQSI